MKIKIVAGYDEVFEKDYKEYHAENDLACTFEYLYQYKHELVEKSLREPDMIKVDVINAKIKHIEKILVYYKDLSTFLHYQDTAL